MKTLVALLSLLSLNISHAVTTEEQLASLIQINQAAATSMATLLDFMIDQGAVGGDWASGGEDHNGYVVNVQGAVETFFGPTAYGASPLNPLFTDSSVKFVSGQNAVRFDQNENYNTVKIDNAHNEVRLSGANNFVQLSGTSNVVKLDGGGLGGAAAPLNVEWQDDDKIVRPILKPYDPCLRVVLCGTDEYSSSSDGLAPPMHETPATGSSSNGIVSRLSWYSGARDKLREMFTFNIPDVGTRTTLEVGTWKTHASGNAHPIILQTPPLAAYVRVALQWLLVLVVGMQIRHEIADALTTVSPSPLAKTAVATAVAVP